MYRPKKDRLYHDKEWLTEEAAKYRDKETGKIAYTQLLRDNELPLSEVSSLVHFLEKFEIDITPAARLKYETDAEKIAELQAERERRQAERLAKGSRGILLSNVPLDTVEGIKKNKGKESYTDYFLGLHYAAIGEKEAQT